MKRPLISDLMLTIGMIAKVALTIVTKVQGQLSLGVVWAVVCCIAAIFVPFGSTICFLVLKLIGHLSLSWAWILLTLVLDGCSINGLLRIFRGES